MKKIYLFNLLLLILPTFLFAQNFAPLGAKWEYEMISNADTTQAFSTYKIDKAITYKGRTAQNLKNTNSSAPYPCPYGVHYKVIDKISVSGDSVFIYVMDKWQLLINFNASVADTFDLEMRAISANWQDTAYVSVHYVVDSLGVLTLNGKQLRSLYLRNANTTGMIFHDGWFTEKIGHQYSVFPWIGRACGEIEYHDYGLVSYSDSVFGSVVLSNQFRDSMNVLTGIDKNPIYNFKGKIYPNPFKNKISIKSDEKIHQLKLYNINGQLMQQVNVNAKGYDWHPIVQAGIYFVKITDQLGNSSIKKLIKTE